MSGRVGVVVVNYGAHELIEANLAGLDLAPVDARVFVVDNLSTAANRLALTVLAGRRGWTVLLPRGNPGFGAGANLGVRAALAQGCEMVLLLNPDARVDTATLAELAEQVAQSPMTAVSPTILRPDGTVWFRGGTLWLHDGRTRSLPPADLPAAAVEHEPVEAWLTAACLMVHRRLWQAVGGFDERFFLYWEDIDFSHRCLQAGGDLLVRPDLTAVHEVGGTQSGADRRGRAKSALYYRYNCRNRLLFARLHLSAGDAARWRAGAPSYARSVLLRGGRRQLLSLASPVWPTALGTLEGWDLSLRAGALR